MAGAGTVDAFLAAVSEAGYPPCSLERTLRSPHVLVTRWKNIHDMSEGLPASVGIRARELTGLKSAHPTSFRVDIDTGEATHWLVCWLWDNGAMDGIDAVMTDA